MNIKFTRTNLYYSGWAEDFLLIPDNDEIKYAPRRDLFECTEKSDADSIIGLIDCSEMNDNYKSLNLLLEGKQSEPEFQKWEPSGDISKHFLLTTKVLWDTNDPIEHITTEQKARVIYEKYVFGKSIVQVAESTSQKHEHVVSILREYKVRRSLHNRLKRGNLREGRKLKEIHIDWLRNRVSRLIGSHFTLSTLRKELFDKFPNLGEISISTISAVLRKKLKMSYKLLGSSNAKERTHQNITKIKQWAHIIKWLEENNYLILYMDEFKVNYKTINHYGWSKKGISGWKSLSSQPFEMSFIVCFSKNSIEGLTGFKKTINWE